MCCGGKLTGKKILWVGTSIPWGGHSANPYPNIVAARMFAKIDNQAVSSSRVGLLGSYDAPTAARSLAATPEQIIAHQSYVDGDEANSYQTKIIGTDADLLIIDHGHNDVLMALGDIDGVDISTFYGGINVIMAAVLIDRPDIEIIFMTPPQSESPTGTRAQIERLAGGVRTIAAKYNRDVIDLLELCPFTAENYLTYFADTLHPNDAGVEVIEQIIVENLK